MDRLHGFIRWVCTKLAILGGVMLICSAVYTAAEVLARRFLAISLGGASEMAAYAFAISSAWAFSFSLLERAHIRIDALYQLASRPLRALVDVLSVVRLAAYAAHAGLVLVPADRIRGGQPHPRQHAIADADLDSAAALVFGACSVSPGGELSWPSASVLAFVRGDYAWVDRHAGLASNDAQVEAPELVAAAERSIEAERGQGEGGRIMILITFGGMLLLLFLGIPVAVALFGLALGLDWMYAWLPLYRAIGTRAWATSNDILLITIPLFILLGEIMLRSGTTERMYGAMGKWLAWLPGGLMHANIGASLAFAASCGSSVATAATVSTVSIPVIEKFKYNERLFLGSLASGGTLGILVPPSINLIVYGFLTETSVPKLYLAGILPGILLASLFMGTIIVLCLWRPAWGGVPMTSTWIARVMSLPDLLPPMSIFFVVLGSIYAGWATPTEAASLGLLGAMLVAALNGRLTWQMLRESDPRRDAHDRHDRADPGRGLVSELRDVDDRRQPHAERIPQHADFLAVLDPDGGDRLLCRPRHRDGADADDDHHGSDHHAADGLARLRSGMVRHPDRHPVRIGPDLPACRRNAVRRSGHPQPGLNERRLHGGHPLQPHLDRDDRHHHRFSANRALASAHVRVIQHSASRPFSSATINQQERKFIMEKIGGMTLKRPITDEVKKTVLEDLAPEIHEIKDPKLKQMVVDAWALSCCPSSFKRITDIPGWGGPDDFYLKRGNQADHLRGVARFSMLMADDMVKHYPEVIVRPRHLHRGRALPRHRKVLRA